MPVTRSGTGIDSRTGVDSGTSHGTATCFNGRDIFMDSSHYFRSLSLMHLYERLAWNTEQIRNILMTAE
jgi:hypothetical protein